MYSVRRKIVKIMVMLIGSTAHPSYCCRSDGHIFLPIRPIQQLLSCLQRSRVEIINCSCRTANQFCRSDGHFLQVGWAFFVGRMGIFRRSDGHFSQVGCTNMLFLTCPSDLLCIGPTTAVKTTCWQVGWAVEGMGIGPKINHPF